MQTQVVAGMTQNGNSQQCISGPVKRQVAEAWKNLRTHGDVGSNTSGYQDQCHCCEHYGLLVFGIGHLKRKLRQHQIV